MLLCGIRLLLIVCVWLGWLFVWWSCGSWGVCLVLVMWRFSWLFWILLLLWRFGFFLRCGWDMCVWVVVWMLWWCCVGGWVWFCVVYFLDILCCWVVWCGGCVMFYIWWGMCVWVWWMCCVCWGCVVGLYFWFWWWLVLVVWCSDWVGWIGLFFCFCNSDRVVFLMCCLWLWDWILMCLGSLFVWIFWWLGWGFVCVGICGWVFGFGLWLKKD